MMSRKRGGLVGAAIAVAMFASEFVTPAYAVSIVLDFPSVNSINGGPTAAGCGGHPQGGGGCHFLFGDSVSEAFFGTGLPSATSSEWEFSIFNRTDPGVDNTFDASINGIVVGSFHFVSTLANRDTAVPFDLSFSFAPIAGNNYALSLVATSTVPSTNGSWDYVPGGTVTLTDEIAAVSLTDGIAAVPGPLAGAGLPGLILAGGGLLGLLRRRKGAQAVAA